MAETREQPAIGKRRKGKGPRGKRDLRKIRAALEAAHQQRTITKTSSVWPAGGTVRFRLET